jgi:hypothetical protein
MSVACLSDEILHYKVAAFFVPLCEKKIWFAQRRKEDKLVNKTQLELDYQMV